MLIEHRRRLGCHVLVSENGDAKRKKKETGFGIEDVLRTELIIRLTVSFPSSKNSHQEASR
jgi:hypothetical protein